MKHSAVLVVMTVMMVKTTSMLPPSPKVVNYRQVEKKILDQILSPAIYDAHIRPKGTGGGTNVTKGADDGATLVWVNLYVRSFEKIDDVKMEYSVQITFRQQWNDNRLQFNNIGGKIKYLTMTERSKVWMPDTFFRNEKDGKFHNIIQPNLYVRVYPNGDVLYSIRVSLTLACPMNLKLFPLDTQTCHLTIASYGWTANDLIYLWKHPNPVQFVSNLFLPGGFELANYSDSKCDVETATGVYSCLSLDMQFKRQLSYYVLTIYVPTFMTVCVSWMSFWLDHKSAPARVALTITTLLAMSTTTSSINSSLPPVAYTKAIDVWNNICVSFVFLALLEYALVNYAARADARALEVRRAAQKQMDLEQREAFDCMRSKPPQPPMHQYNNGQYPGHRDNGGGLRLRGGDEPDEFEMFQNGPFHGLAGYPRDEEKECGLDSPRKVLFAQLLPLNSKKPKNGQVRSVLAPKFSFHYNPGAKKIDVISRVMFPATFFGLNIIYWSYYLTKAEYAASAAL